MPNVQISFNTRRANGLLRSSTVGDAAGRYLIDALEAVVSGHQQSDGLVWSANDDTALGATAHLGHAIGVALMATSSGTVGAVIRGVTSTVTWGTSDIATQTALAAQIRALATVNRVVTATNIAARVTLATVTAGQFLDICNTRFTGVAGTPALVGDFSIDTSDTAAALSLAQAVNRHPSLALRFRAVSAAGLLYVFPTTSRALSAFECISNPGGFSTVTLTAPLFVASAALAIIAAVPGDIGNEVRLTATGTNVSALTNGTTGFLGNGTGGGILPNVLVP